MQSLILFLVGNEEQKNLVSSLHFNPSCLIIIITIFLVQSLPYFSEKQWYYLPHPTTTTNRILIMQYRSVASFTSTRFKISVFSQRKHTTITKTHEQPNRWKKRKEELKWKAKRWSRSHFLSSLISSLHTTTENNNMRPNNIRLLSLLYLLPLSLSNESHLWSSPVQDRTGYQEYNLTQQSNTAKKRRNLMK